MFEKQLLPTLGFSLSNWFAYVFHSLKWKFILTLSYFPIELFLFLVVIFFCFGFCWSLIGFVAVLLDFYKLFPYVPFALLFWYKNDLKNGFTPSSKICVPEPPAIFCAVFFGVISCNLAHTGQSLIQNIVLKCLSNLFFLTKEPGHYVLCCCWQVRFCSTLILLYT